MKASACPILVVVAAVPVLIVVVPAALLRGASIDSMQAMEQVNHSQQVEAQSYALTYDLRNIEAAALAISAGVDAPGLRGRIEDLTGWALFNQDNGTGRVVNINGQGFLHSYEFLQRWLAAVPGEYRNHIQTTFPGTPSSGGSDHASFIAAGAPAFFLSALNWSYYNYTWHTNIDTYDKIVFDDVRNNAILTAILAYMASEDPESFPRDRAVLPLNPRTGEQMNWPGPRTPNRTGNN